MGIRRPATAEHSHGAAHRAHAYKIAPRNPNAAQAIALYDADEDYLGQERPLAIPPLTGSNAIDGEGISILAGEDCADRIWSVNASIVGENLHTTDTNLSRMSLRKNNRFFSQWCGDQSPDGSDFQAGFISGRNLFLDPAAANDDDLPQTPALIDPTRNFVSARLQLRFNVAQSELESESYVDGDSQELAGHGLYGDYSLFIPAETMALDGSDGLILSQVEDILLRFDSEPTSRVSGWIYASLKKILAS